MNGLEGWQESLFEAGILRSQSLKDLTVDVKDYGGLDIRFSVSRSLLPCIPTYIVLLHGSKGVKEGLDVGNAVLRVSCDA